MRATQTAAEPREAASTKDIGSASVIQSARTLIADPNHIESTDFTAARAKI